MRIIENEKKEHQVLTVLIWIRSIQQPRPAPLSLYATGPDFLPPLYPPTSSFPPSVVREPLSPSPLPTSDIITSALKPRRT